MQKLCAVLLSVFVLAAAGNLNPVTAVAEEKAVPRAEALVRVEAPVREPATDGFIVGVVDTIGGTTYDWLANGPIWRMMCNSSDYGVHALWMYSASNQTTFPDRNMRYNFYDYAVDDWNWVDPDYMLSGINVFTERVGYGGLDADPVAGVALVSGHLGTPLRTDVARDVAPGAGLFEYCVGTPTLEGYLWPPISAGQNQYVHIACIDDASRNSVFYSGMMTWCQYTDPIGVAAPQPDPAFPDQNIAASKVSDKVCLTWVYSPTGYSQKPGFYRISTDAGVTWGDPTQLPWPQAYQGDTLTSFGITSLFPFYDRSDRLHIVADVEPFYHDTNYILPPAIWHWSPDNSPEWTLIHRYNVRNISAAVGYNATMACRPSIGDDQYGGLYVAWEQFDSANVEPGPPSRLRADIFYAQDQGNNGTSWLPAVKITDRTTASHRFPSVVDRVAHDSLWIVYMIDQRAGFFVQGEGPATNNAVVVHKVPVVVGIKAQPEGIPRALKLEAAPNPFTRQTCLSYALPRPGRVRVDVFDPTGRPVACLVEGSQDAGWHSTRWYRQNYAPGVYLVRLTSRDGVETRKLVLTE